MQPHPDPSLLSVIAGIPFLSELSAEETESLLSLSSTELFPVGRSIIGGAALPDFLYIISSGRVRMLVQDDADRDTHTLCFLGTGDIVGWTSLVRRQPTESAIASEETLCLKIPSVDVEELINVLPALYERLHRHTDPAEIHSILQSRYADDYRLAERVTACGFTDLRELTLHLFRTAVAFDTSFGRKIPPEDRQWIVSRSSDPDLTVGSLYVPSKEELPGSSSLRLIGLDVACMDKPLPENGLAGDKQNGSSAKLPAGGDNVKRQPSNGRNRFEFDHSSGGSGGTTGKLPFFRGNGVVDRTLACFLMLGRHWNIPVRKDLVQGVLSNQFSRNSRLSLQDCGGVGVLLGLKARIANPKTADLQRLTLPALIHWDDSFAVLYQVSSKTVVLGDPSSKEISRFGFQEFIDRWKQPDEVLVLEPGKETPGKKFGLGWFVPSVIKYRAVLAEVLIASFFSQLMTLVNPLLFMIIIDQVIVRNSIDTLHVLGGFMLATLVIEAVLSSLKTWLFVDTANRIDVSLGADVIDHLFRLPLRFFEKRPVGELSSRIGELERIRQFLTGTALGVVMDAVFSFVYVAVLFAFSWKLALMSLSVIPLIGLITFILSPIIRQQLREKSLRHGAANAYLIEVLSGIQTVKSQNIELSSRWKWQEKYAAYVKDGFKPVISGTLANSATTFLSKASGLIVIWAGAYLVLSNEMTLGQLIAFRIIAGFITSPVMRLSQLWQNFQETAMSLERLSDIVDTPEEGGREQLAQIPLPELKGEIRFENVSFRFRQSGRMVLDNVNVTIPAGTFVGIVGQSGSGKSTFAKLVPRLYNLDQGRIFIDGYDIAKVELNSLRSQIGTVPQDPLLFDSSVRDNIALTNPEAADVDIVHASRIAEAHDFIMALPMGYTTPVGEKGASLSGGQRQRIAIGRTILQNPGVIILDEATSALDPQTESTLTSNMMQEFGGKTVLFITHRINSVKNADMILCFHDGRIDEVGTHQELMEMNGRYCSLFRKQSAETPAVEVVL